MFGEIAFDQIQLNQHGIIVSQAWNELPMHYPHIGLSDFCIMPNHVHGIIILKDDLVGAGLRPAPTVKPVATRPAITGPAPTTTNRYPLSEIVRAFKSFSARRINEINKSRGNPVWQRNYYEHIIQGNEDYLAILNYIHSNPANWAKDDENITR